MLLCDNVLAPSKQRHALVVFRLYQCCSIGISLSNGLFLAFCDGNPCTALPLSPVIHLRSQSCHTWAMAECTWLCMKTSADMIENLSRDWTCFLPRSHAWIPCLHTCLLSSMFCAPELALALCSHALAQVIRHCGQQTYMSCCFTLIVLHVGPHCNQWISQ
jgi:hypothetical protein